MLHWPNQCVCGDESFGMDVPINNVFKSSRCCYNKVECSWEADQPNLPSKALVISAIKGICLQSNEGSCLWADPNPLATC